MKIFLYLGVCMDKIKWLFFDIGSTLVDETDCIKKRCEVIVKENNIDSQEFYNKVKEYAKTESYAVQMAADYYSVDVPRWYGEFEKLYPETKSMLESLSEKYKLGIIANQNAGTKTRLKNWNIDKFFDIVITSAECGCAKPDLKIFKMALEQANCTTDECVMIGDRIDNDIAPAKQLGMKTVWVRQGFSKYQSAKSVSVQPNFIVDKVSELVKIFK